MSLDSSLKMSGGLTKHRNVLTRAERVAKLMEQGNFTPGEDNPIGLPKVISRKIATGKKKVKKKTEGDDDE
jgi:small basic protein (TIGR04137 family)